MIPGVSVKVLSEVLKEMEANDLLVRKQYEGIPVRVTYEIHPDAQKFIEANIVCTIKIGEYILKNSQKLNISTDILVELSEWLALENARHDLGDL